MSEGSSFDSASGRIVVAMSGGVDSTVTAALLARDNRVFADLARQDARLFPIDRDLFDKGQRIGMLRVVFRQVGRHLEGRVNHHVIG